MPDQAVSSDTTEVIPASPVVIPMPAKRSIRFKLFLALGVSLLVFIVAIIAVWQLSLNQTPAADTPTVPQPDTAETPGPVPAEPPTPLRLIYVLSPSGSTVRGDEYYEIHLTDTERSFDETVYTSNSFLQQLSWKDENTLIIHDGFYGDLNPTYYLKSFDISTKDPVMLASSQDSRGLYPAYYQELQSPVYSDPQYDSSQNMTVYNLVLRIGSEYQTVYSWGLDQGSDGAIPDLSGGNWDQSPDASHYLSYFNLTLRDKTQPNLIIFDTEGNIVDSIQNPNISNAQFVSDTEIIFKESTIGNFTEGRLFKYNFVTKIKQEVGPYTYSQTSVDIANQNIVAMQYYPYAQAQVPDVVILDLDTLALKQTFASSVLQNENYASLYMIGQAIYDASNRYYPYKITSKLLLEDGVSTKFMDAPDGQYIRVYFEPDWDK